MRCTDPWTGAASQPAYPWRGRITCDPAPGQRGIARRHCGCGDADRCTFFGGGPDEWNYRQHGAALRRSSRHDAGGVDAIPDRLGIESLTRVRSASGVYPAVDALATLAADVKAIVGCEHRRHLRRRLDRIRIACGRSLPRTKCAFRSIRCGRRRSIDVGRHRLLRAAGRLARRRRTSRPSADRQIRIA